MTPERRSRTAPPRSLAGLLQVCLAGVLWGTGGLVVQLVRERVPVPVLTVSAYRTAIAAMVLVLAVVLLRRTPGAVALARRQPWRTAIVGAATGAYQALYFGAVVAVGVSVATVVALGLAPVLLTVLDVVRGRRVGGVRVVVLAAALAGLVLVSVAGIGQGGTGGDRPVLGLALAAASGAGYALATRLGEDLARDADPLVVATVTTTWGAALLVPAGIVAGVRGGHLVTGDPAVLGLLAYLGVVSMALAYALLYAGLRTTSSSAATIASLLEPATAALLAAWLLDERLGTLGIIGTAMILAAVAGLGVRPRTVPP